MDVKVKGIILLHTVANRRASVISTSRAGVTVYSKQIQSLHIQLEGF